jgi:hypothetical protein
MMAGTVWLGIGGGCLPDNFWADKAGEIVNGLIIGALNLGLSATGIQI